MSHSLVSIQDAFAACMVGFCILGLVFIYFYRKLWKRLHLLTQELQQRQHLTGQVFSKIHNDPLQLLAFLMRELQSRDVSSEELYDHLQNVYAELQAAIHCLQEK
ncbi:MAG: hypothetical protein AAGD25_37135 [Cyanobacteria bacterium P01_F01_bin.150]